MITIGKLASKFLKSPENTVCRLFPVYLTGEKEVLARPPTWMPQFREKVFKKWKHYSVLFQSEVNKR